VAQSQLAQRVAYAESLGQGLAAVDLRGPAKAEVQALLAEVMARLQP